MVDFRNILNKKVEDIKAPPLVPVGTYRARISKPAAFEEIAQGKFKVIDFMLLLVEPMMDVSQEELASYGGLSAASVMRQRFMFSTEDTPEAAANVERTLFNMKRFLCEHLGLQGDDMNQLVSQAQGNECLVNVGWRPDPKDPSIQYNDIKRTAPLPV